MYFIIVIIIIIIIIILGHRVQGREAEGEKGFKKFTVQSRKIETRKRKKRREREKTRYVR
jgi:hypothetical protein